MAQRDKGNGSVFQRRMAAGSAQIAATACGDTAYAKSEREARAKLKELRATAQQGSLGPDQPRPSAEYLEWWLETARPRLKPTTHEWYSTCSFGRTSSRPSAR